ncbi:unnamed protein product [Cyclocybe aegerita]|uniref:BTB domain-containing protein n=1 Tax=Cyclocybe aegerita TaxID=1973307 RepID=A0A8S0VUZ4_CYCAE|nr:unnamed protein product [Cyclocybe aegerita]
MSQSHPMNSDSLPAQPSTPSTEGVLEGPSTIIRNHPIYFFEDGSLILDVEIQRFKVHHTLLSRHSRFFSSRLPTERGSAEHSTHSASTSVHKHDVKDESEGERPQALQRPPGSNGFHHVVLEPKLQVRVEDIEALFQHLYHDAPLGKDSPFSRIAGILRVSSPQQLDFPVLHSTAKSILQGMFPTDPETFTHTHPLHDALPIATDFHLPMIRKAILYSLVTTTDFDVSDTTPNADAVPSVDPQSEIQNSISGSTGVPTHASTGPNSDSIAPSVGASEFSSIADVAIPENTATPAPAGAIRRTALLSPADAETCMTLMTRLIEHFTPILFTPAATPHMACTDVFADTWMPLVIEPALADDGVYKPLETLERMKGIDWAKRGLCAECVLEKQEEWTEEQRVVWKHMDQWLGIDVEGESRET